MKLAVSEIAWEQEQSNEALEILREYGFAGLEIVAPRVAGPSPYQHPDKAADFAAGVRRAFGLTICSMQSIWFGQQGSLFGPEREALLEYTRQAVLFAEAAGCRNLVFGCPKNRVRPEGKSNADAVPFFKELAQFAAAHGTVIALEANPTIYGTNFINKTPEAFAMVAQVGQPGFAVNLDFGTIIANGEDVNEIRGKVAQISHVHISAPQLALVQPQAGHKTLAAILREEDYKGYVSLEMKQQSMDDLRKTVAYVAEVFA